MISFRVVTFCTLVSKQLGFCTFANKGENTIWNQPRNHHMHSLSPYEPVAATFPAAFPFRGKQTAAVKCCFATCWSWQPRANFSRDTKYIDRKQGDMSKLRFFKHIFTKKFVQDLKGILKIKLFLILKINLKSKHQKYFPGNLLYPRIESSFSSINFCRLRGDKKNNISIKCSKAMNDTIKLLSGVRKIMQCTRYI